MRAIVDPAKPGRGTTPPLATRIAMPPPSLSAGRMPGSRAASDRRVRSASHAAAPILGRSRTPTSLTYTTESPAPTSPTSAEGPCTGTNTSSELTRPARRKKQSTTCERAGVPASASSEITAATRPCERTEDARAQEPMNWRTAAATLG